MWNRKPPTLSTRGITHARTITQLVGLRVVGPLRLVPKAEFWSRFGGLPALGQGRRGRTLTVVHIGRSRRVLVRGWHRSTCLRTRPRPAHAEVKRVDQLHDLGGDRRPWFRQPVLNVR